MGPSKARRSLCLDHKGLHCGLCSVMSSSNASQTLRARFASHASTTDCSLKKADSAASVYQG